MEIVFQIDMYQSWEIYAPFKTGKMAHGSTLTELKYGDIMVAWYSGKSEKNASVGIYSSIFRVSESDWTEPKLIEKKDDRSTEGNPVLFFDKNMNRIWLFWVTVNKMVKIGGEWHFGGWSKGQVKCKHSDDYGLTWTQPRYLHKPWGWMVRNKPIQMSNGTILLPFYIELFNYSSSFLFCASESFKRGALESNWVRGPNIKSGILQPTVVEFENGHLLAYHRTTKGGSYGGSIAMTESFDYGNNWTEPKKTILPNPNSGCDMVKLRSGNLILAFNNSSKNRNDLSLGLSKDKGRTWTIIKWIEYKKGQRFSYPAIIEASDGTVYCTYTNKRKNIKCVHFDEDWLLSQ
jgi:predicted neuraminidase